MSIPIPKFAPQLAWSFIEKPVLKHLFERKLDKVLLSTLQEHGHKKENLLLSNKTSVLNYCTSCINPRIPRKELDFLSAALAFECARQEIHYSPEELYDLSLKISENWFLALLNDNMLRKHLWNRFTFSPAEAIRQLEPPTIEFLEKLKDPLNAQKQYLESFSEIGPFIVKVYIPDPVSHTAGEDGPSVAVQFRSLSRVQLGFFQRGNDYRLVAPYDNWLMMVFTDSEFTREFPDFGHTPEFSWPQTPIPIWVR